MTRGGIANWHTGGLLGLLHHGPPAPKMGKNPVQTGNLSVSIIQILVTASVSDALRIFLRLEWQKE